MAHADAPSISGAFHHHEEKSRSWFAILRDAGKAWNEDNVLRLSAALAYYSIFSIAPLLVITLGIAGLVLESQAATGEIFNGLKSYVGPKAAEGVQAMVQSASKPQSGIIATVVGAATLLLGAAGVLSQLKDALNTIWRVRLKPGGGIGFFIKTKFLNFGMVLVIGLLLLVSLVLSTLLTSLNQSFSQVLELPAWFWTSLGLLMSLAMETVLFALLFKMLPDVEVRWKDVWVGAGITAVLFEIGKMGLSWYLGRQSTADAYGPAASIVLLILWVYYASCIMLFGAEFTQAWAAATGHVIKPSEHAEPLNADEKKSSSVPRATRAAGMADGGRDELTPAAALMESARDIPRPPIKHRLFGPLLKYLEGRGMLASIEAKEALAQAAVILVLAAGSCVTVFVAWTLLALSLVGVLTSHFHWYWVNAAAATGALHLLVAGLLGFFIWRKATKGAWFAETINELRKDRLWLKGTPN